jgi:hypothetical protein
MGGKPKGGKYVRGHREQQLWAIEARYMNGVK